MPNKNPLIYTNNQFQDILCSYAKVVYQSSPKVIRDLLLPGLSRACSENAEFTDNGPPPPNDWTDALPLGRKKWTIPDVLKILEDPWFTWDMLGGCNINSDLLKDIFNDDSFNLDSKLINPVVNTQGFNSEQTDLIKGIGGVYHYYFARTYYIDLCYGTKKYTEIYGTPDCDDKDIVENGLIKGSVLLDAWQNKPNFKPQIDPAQFIKSLTGLVCDDFFKWSNTIFWWKNPKSWSGSWVDDISMQTSLSINSNSTEIKSINIGESKLIKNIDNEIFAGYRISVNDLYKNIIYPDSDALANLFGLIAKKGPLSVQDIPVPFNLECFIENCDPTPTPSVTPVVMPQSSCYLISGSGFPVTNNCYILTDLTEHVDALGNWPMSGVRGFNVNSDGYIIYNGTYQYSRGVFDSAGVYHEFSAFLSMPGSNGGMATMMVTLKVSNSIVSSWTYAKELNGSWSTPVTFDASNIISQTGNVCTGGMFEVTPCRCHCAKPDGLFPKNPSNFGIYKGRSRLEGNKTYWVAEVVNNSWTGNYICVDPWTVPDLKAGDIVPQSAPFCSLCSYTPEFSSVPGFWPKDGYLGYCVCYDPPENTSAEPVRGPQGISEQCKWTAPTLQTDRYGNKVAYPSLQNGNTLCEIITPSPTPSPPPSPPPPTPSPTESCSIFPITIILSNYTSPTGLAENCNCYNGTYIVNEPDIETITSVCPPNSYVLEASVKTIYDSYHSRLFVTITVKTPDSYAEDYVEYEINSSTGNYYFVSETIPTPWCLGSIDVSINKPCS